MVFNGTIKDKETQKGIPYASVKIMTGDGRYTGVGTSADANGVFKINDNAINWPNYALISASEYEAAAWELYDDYLNNIEVFLTRQVKELDPVIIKSDKKSNAGLLILAAIAIAATQKRKAVGEVGFNMPTVLTSAAIVLAIKSFGVLDQLLSVLGLGKDKADKDFESENQDPGSPLKPNLYINATTAQKQKAYQAIVSTATQKGQQLIDAFGGFNDDEAQAIGVFKSFQTKIQVSAFAYIWEKEWQYPDLLQWLKGDAYPNDRLSTNEIKEITDYIDNLPTY